VILYKVTVRVLGKAQLHLIRLDAYSRLALIIAGAMGAYSLGANNIANVMGVFVASNPFTSFEVGNLFTFSGVQQLFLIGAMAIAVGVFTYSKKVMMTVGGGLMSLSPVAAWVVVVAHSIVLFLFASQGLESFLASNGLPTIPLVPVSSSQAVVGAVIGLGLMKGGREINYRVLGNIASGWVTTPAIACLVCFVSLFFLQNVFNQAVYRDTTYQIEPIVLEKLVGEGLRSNELKLLMGITYNNVSAFRSEISDLTNLTATEESRLLDASEIVNFKISGNSFYKLQYGSLTPAQYAFLEKLIGNTYKYKWLLDEALANQGDVWRQRPDTSNNKAHNKELQKTLEMVHRLFRSDTE
jgi:PiT family inorganic phosphate transporter